LKPPTERFATPQPQPPPSPTNSGAPVLFASITTSTVSSSNRSSSSNRVPRPAPFTDTTTAPTPLSTASTQNTPPSPEPAEKIQQAPIWLLPSLPSTSANILPSFQAEGHKRTMSALAAEGVADSCPISPAAGDQDYFAASPVPTPPELTDGGGAAATPSNDSPTPSAPWLVQEALSVQAAIEEAVRGVGFGGDRAGDEGTGASSGARVVEGNEALSSGGRRIRRRNAATFPPEVMAKVPRLVADLHSALGRGVSTAEAKAWLRELDRLGEGLDSRRLLTACLVSR
ncbi:unnamed protein product, partial [Sphacelaria rigidula]